MSDKFWYFVNRNGDDRRLFPGTHEGFEAARELQDEYNGGTPQELWDGVGLEAEGSEDEGSFFIDDGGRLELLEVEEVSE